MYQIAYDDVGNSVAVRADYHVAPYDRAPGAFVKFYLTTDLDDPKLNEPPNYALLMETTSVYGPPHYWHAGKSEVHLVQMKFTVTKRGAGNPLYVFGGQKWEVLVDGKGYE